MVNHRFFCGQLFARMNVGYYLKIGRFCANFALCWVGLWAKSTRIQLTDEQKDTLRP